MTSIGIVPCLAALALFGPIGWQEILIVLLIILLLFGGKKLPELARGIGKGLREFKKGIHNVEEDIESAVDPSAESKEDSPPSRPEQEGPS